MDNKCRCRWCNPRNPLYIAYHDSEWGVPQYDDHKLFELLLLELFQAGLSWETILNKRENFRTAFDGFDPKKVSRYDGDKVRRLLENPGIVRNCRKIEAAICNAAVFLQVREQWGSFRDYIWHFTEGKVIYETDKTNSPLSDAISKDLRRRGMRFVGTTIVYSYLQAIGLIYSHEPGCFLHVPPEEGKVE